MEVHIEREVGLVYAGDDAAFYEQLVAIYVKQAAEKVRQLGKAFSEGDLKAYTIQAHGIKSNAKMIGAVRLAELSFELEKAGKEGDMNMIREKQRPFMKEFVAVLEEAKKMTNS